jgi:hypothetical protein
MEKVQAFPNFKELYTAITRSAALEDLYKNEKARIQQLATGLHIFLRRDAAVSGQLKNGKAAPLANAPTWYSGEPGNAAAAWDTVAKLLNLHEAQTLLLLQGWMRDNLPNATAEWSPSSPNLHAICMEFFSQRWHLLLSLRTLVDVATDDLHASCNAAKRILSDFGCATLLTNILRTAASTLMTTGASFTTRAAHGTGPPSDGTLILSDTSHVLPRWREQATGELCSMLIIALKLMHLSRTVAPAPDSLRAFAKAFLQHLDSLEPSAIQDENSMTGLVSRLAVVILVRGLECW